ncbi:MAG: hypothetical protein ABSC08_17040 [Bryobacteraceae bacterium]|jgi:hypothetical protein
MPNWCRNSLTIRLQKPDDQKPRWDEFDELRLFVGHTLCENVDWLFKQPPRGGPSKPLSGIPTGIAWGSLTEVNLCIPSGAELWFESAWGPPDEWLLRIHECYPRWRFVNDYMIECLCGAGLIEWDGTEWTEEHEGERYPEPGETTIVYSFKGGRLSAELRAERAKQAERDRQWKEAAEKSKQAEVGVSTQPAAERS